MANRSPNHPLTIVRMKLTVPTLPSDDGVTATITGENPYARDPLWRWHESWTVQDLHDGLDPVDSLRWVLTMVMMDHPRSQEHLERQLTHGEGWEQLDMFELSE